MSFVFYLLFGKDEKKTKTDTLKQTETSAADSPFRITAKQRAKIIVHSFREWNL